MSVPHPTELPGSTSDLVAAVDLGSNSFHMVIGRFVDHQLQILDRVREQVCLAQGLDSDRRISEEAQLRGISCLEKMGQRIREFPADRVRAVGTNTLRSAKGAKHVRRRFEEALGHSIEIIPGIEEARLIYLGVVVSHFSLKGQFVADIGGGSTEIILGEGFDVKQKNSFFMGCVTFSQRFFPDGTLSKECFREAEIAARLELQPAERTLDADDWRKALGASGTIRAVQEVIEANGWSQGGITRTGLKRLRRSMIEAQSVGKLDLPGLRKDRIPVFPGGVAILRGIFKAFDIEHMEACSGALREGVLHDLIGRIEHVDVRDETIRSLVDRYHVDTAQAKRIERTALHYLKSVGGVRPEEPEWGQRFLKWTARLHEIGLAIRHTGFHKHGAYLLTHCEMPGFSADDQSILAALVRTQRRKLSKELFKDVRSELREDVQRLAILFRLAAVLNRSRVELELPSLKLQSKDWQQLELEVPADWEMEQPLTIADLKQEASFLKGLGARLRIKAQPQS